MYIQCYIYGIACIHKEWAINDLLFSNAGILSSAHIRDPSNASHPIRNLHIVVHDMNNHPPQNVLARKLLNDVVSNSLPQHSADMMPNNVVTMGNHDLQLDGMHSTPWNFIQQLFYWPVSSWSCIWPHLLQYNYCCVIVTVIVIMIISTASSVASYSVVIILHSIVLKLFRL